MIATELNNQVKTLIEQSKQILVLPSSPPDGDSIGSALALYIVLKKMGKEATVVCADPIPDVYAFLPQLTVIKNEFFFARDLIVTIDCTNTEVATVNHDIQPDKVNIIITPKKGQLDAEKVHINYGKTKFDLIITVDAGDVSQFGKIYEDNPELFHLAPVINIDHHISNTQFGKINVVDIMASSASSILMEVIENIDARLIDADVATLLLAGVITDTGSFQNPNTTPDSFAIAAKLIEKGARQQEIIQHVYKTKKMSTLKLWGRILSKIQYDQAHHLVWSTVSKKDFEETHSTPDETDGLIDELMTNAPGCMVAFLLKDKNDGIVSGSLRTTTAAVDASKIAEHFGGGGHLQAAGFKVTGKSLEDIEKEVGAYIRDMNISPNPTTTDEPRLQEPEEKFAPVEAEPPKPALPQTFPTPLDMREPAKPAIATPVAPITVPPTNQNTNAQIVSQAPSVAVPQYNPVATPDELV